MKKSFLFILLMIVFFLFVKECMLLIQTDKEIDDLNYNVLKEIKDLKFDSILYYNGELYVNDNSTYDIDDTKKIPLKYDMATYDIDLMPIVFLNSVIICQTHSLKIFEGNIVHEFHCNEQILSITFPQSDNDSLIFYIIKFDSAKVIYKVPKYEQKWVLQKVVFRNGKFFTETISDISIPENLTFNRIKSEVSFFSYSNNIISIALTDDKGEIGIYQFSRDGKYIKKSFDGCIIIPNKFINDDLWYIKKDDQNGYHLMKNNDVVKKINQFITQGHFIAEDTIELVFYDTSEFGTINYYPKYTSFLYNINKNQIINTYYKKSKENNKDNILVIF